MTDQNPVSGRPGLECFGIEQQLSQWSLSRPELESIGDVWPHFRLFRAHDRVGTNLSTIPHTLTDVETEHQILSTAVPTLPSPICQLLMPSKVQMPPHKCLVRSSPRLPRRFPPSIRRLREGSCLKGDEITSKIGELKGRQIYRTQFIPF